MDFCIEELLKQNQKIEDIHSIIYHKFNENNFIKSPLTATLSIENKCNLNCKHCWDKMLNISKKKIQTPNFEMIKMALDKLKKEQILHLVLTGGEIFLRKDIWEILKYIKKQKFFLTVLTNGTLLKTIEIQRLLAIIDKRTDIVQISLDGLENSHNIQRGANVFSNVIETIKRLSDEGLKVRVHFVATPININDIKETYIFLNSMKIYEFSLSSVYGKNRGVTLEKNFDYFKYLKSIYEVKKLSETYGNVTKFEYTIPVQCFKFFTYGRSYNQSNNKKVFLKQYYSNIRINVFGDMNLTLSRELCFYII